MLGVAGDGPKQVELAAGEGGASCSAMLCASLGTASTPKPHLAAGLRHGVQLVAVQWEAQGRCECASMRASSGVGA